MSYQDNIKELIVKHIRRLQKLKERQAIEGLSTDPKISIEIEDIEVEIEKLRSKLKEEMTREEVTLDPIDIIKRAEAEKRAASFKASAMLELEQARANAERLRGLAKAEVRAEHLRRILEVLRGQPPEVVSAVLQNLSSFFSAEDEPEDTN